MTRASMTAGQVEQNPTAAVSQITLRPYQVAAVEAVRAGYRGGQRRILVVLATGLGKTIVFAYLAHQAAQRGGRALVLAHREELLTQARKKILLVDPTADVGIVRAEQDETDAAIVVASIQTLARPARLARLGRFSLIIVDEAHHVAAASYRGALTALGAFEPGGPVVLGVTATPGRGDGLGLDSVFQEIVYEMSILDGIRDGFLSDVRAIRVGLDTDFSAVHSRGGDLDDGELGDALLAADAPEHVTAAYLEHARGRRAILFAPTVAVARPMADALRQAGVASAWVSGDTPRKDRGDILTALQAGTVQVVANCSLLTEGFDEPSVSCVIVARPTKSSALYAQMIGRGTRPYPGKRDCLVLDVVGQAGRHNLVTAASLFGVTPQLLDSRTLTEALEARRREEAEQAALALGRLVSAPVDLFRARPLNWIERQDGRFVLTVSGGNIVLTQTRAGWTAAFSRYSGPTEVLGRDLPLEYAQGVTEDRARRLGGSLLADPNASWRQKPASEKQLALLRRWGLLGPQRNPTAGEASDLITAGRRRA